MKLLTYTGRAGEQDVQVLADPGEVGHLVQGITIQALSGLQIQILERRRLRESGPALAQSARLTLEQLLLDQEPESFLEAQPPHCSNLQQGVSSIY
jgi:hypothetical protein